MKRPRPGVWARQHGASVRAAAGELARARLGTALSALVLGITLALPALGLLAVETLARASRSVDTHPQLSAYLHVDTPAAAARALAERVQAWDEVRSARLITPEMAREELAAGTELGPLLALLDDNPLPATVVVRPGAEDPEAARALRDRLAAADEVERVQADLEWVTRLQAAVTLGERAVGLLGTLLALGVVLVTGNTIRLAILSRRDEIEILKLVGGSDAFVRRPFLYSGLLQGLAGGLVAAALVAAAQRLLAGPAATLGQLYGGTALAGLGASRTLALIVLGAGLGLAGAWLAVTRHLREIEPR